MSRRDLKTPGESVAVVGLGKLGTPLTATLAGKGFSVIRVDISSDFVTKLIQRIGPVEESGLQAMLNGSIGGLRASSDNREAILNSEIA